MLLIRFIDRFTFFLGGNQKLIRGAYHFDVACDPLKWPVALSSGLAALGYGTQYFEEIFQHLENYY